MIRRHFSLAHAAAVVCLLTGISACASGPRAPTEAEIEAQYRPIEGGVLVDEGVRIDAEDGSFSLTTGRFVTPFQMRMAPLRWSPIFALHDYNGREFRNAVTEAWPLALARGAVKVRVTIPGLEAPLYGVIQFNKAHASAVGSAARAHRLTIPQQYIDLASEAKVSVVYDQMKRSDGREAFSWVLWLSDFPNF